MNKTELIKDNLAAPIIRFTIIVSFMIPPCTSLHILPLWEGK